MHGCQVTWICSARQCLSRPVRSTATQADQSRHGPASSVMPWDANPVCSQTFIHPHSKKLQKQTKFLPKYLTWYWEAEYNNHEIHIPRWLHPLYRPSWLKQSHFRAIWGELTVFSPLRYSTSIIKVHVCRHVIHAFHFKTSTICELNSANIIPKYINPIVSSFFTVPMSLCSTVFLVSFIKVT